MYISISIYLSDILGKKDALIFLLMSNLLSYMCLIFSETTRGRRAR